MIAKDLDQKFDQGVEELVDELDPSTV
jgi:hypothetical protein